MASSRVLAEDLIEAVFDDDFELEDEEDSENDSDDDIYSYLGDPVLRHSDLMAATLGELDDGSEHSELIAASLGVIDGDERSGSGEDNNRAESSISAESSGISSNDDGTSPQTSDTAHDRSVLAPYLVRTKQ